MPTIRIQTRDGYQIVFLDRPKANAIDPTLVGDLAAALADAESDSSIRGFIVAGRPGFFSAGLDLPSLAPLEREAMNGFWQDLDRLLLAIYESPLVVMSAMTGHAPAGGCVLCLMTDYRVMAEGSFKIGLNEAAMGLVVPYGVLLALRRVVGERVAERLATTGELLDPSEALSLGLVDELADPEEVLDRTEAAMRRWLASVPHAQAETKRRLRAPIAADWRRHQEADRRTLMDLWFDPVTRAGVAAVVERLGK